MITSTSSLRHAFLELHVAFSRDRGEHVEADRGPNLRVEHVGKQTFPCRGSVVNETVNRPELPAQPSHERRDHSDIAQIEGTELQETEPFSASARCLQRALHCRGAQRRLLGSHRGQGDPQSRGQSHG